MNYWTTYYSNNLQMRLKRGHITDALWLILILLLLFTPLGFTARVHLTRLFSFSPDTVEQTEQTKLNDYHWSLKDLKGDIMDMEQLKGEVILVNFWATWCPPCVAEMPSLVALHEDYGEDVAFVFLANDKRDKVVQYLDKKGYNLPVYFSQGGIPSIFDASSIPVTYVLDKNGNIIVAEKGAADWNAKKVRELLTELISH